MLPIAHNQPNILNTMFQLDQIKKMNLASDTRSCDRFLKWVELALRKNNKHIIKQLFTFGLKHNIDDVAQTTIEKILKDYPQERQQHIKQFLAGDLTNNPQKNGLDILKKEDLIDVNFNYENQ